MISFQTWHNLPDNVAEVLHLTSLTISVRLLCSTCNKCVGRDDRGPPWQRTQAYTASLVPRDGCCSNEPPPVKQHIGTMVHKLENGRSSIFHCRTESVEPAADWTELNIIDICLSPRTENVSFQLCILLRITHAIMTTYSRSLRNRKTYANANGGCMFRHRWETDGLQQISGLLREGCE